MNKILYSGFFVFLLLLFGLPLEKVIANQSQKTQLTTPQAYFVSSPELEQKFYKVELDKKINISVTSEKVEQALRKVAQATGLKLTYRGDIMNDKKITLNRQKIGVNEALTHILEDTGLDYKFSKNGYLLVHRKSEEVITVDLQEEVEGQVTDATNGEALPGVNIVVKGTDTGTSTGAEGAFELTVPSLKDTLVFSFIGYQTQEVPLNGQSEIDVQLQSEAITGEEVVVVGYGEQEQERVTGSISSVPTDEFENEPVSDLSTALQGKASGVEIVRSGGDPGASGAIRIRGTGTVNNADPLIVIDGMPSDVNSLNNINSDDVESIDILKDASSAAIYGNRAANGVILVTTKGGQFDQDLRLNFNTSLGLSRPIGMVEVLDAPTLAELKRERYTNDGIPINPIWEDEQYQTQRTNWQEELMGTGVVQDYSLSIEGGSSNSSYFVSGNFTDEQGMMESSYFDRYGLKINSNHRITDRLNIRQNLSLTRTSSNTLNTSSAQNGVLWSAIRFHPGLPVKLEDGSYSSSQISGEFGDINNPIFTVEEDSDSENKQRRILGNVEAELDLLPWLSLRGNVGLDYQIEDTYNFDIIIDNQIRARSTNSLERSYAENTSLNSELFMSFEKLLAENHDIDGVAGLVLEKSNGETVLANRQNFTDESQSNRVLDAGNTVNLAEGGMWEDVLLSYVGRVNYAYADKYLLSASLRYDGSSRFAPDNRWGVFPAFSVGWRISEEDFFDSLTPMFSSLRLTSGWGRSGNQSIDRHQYLGLYSQNSQYSFAGTEVRGVSQTRLPNQDISWETVEMLNFGLHAGLFDDRVDATIEYFIRDSKDVLLAPPILGTRGTANVPDQNVGEIRNNGLEVKVGYNRSIGSFSFHIGGNASLIRNEVINLNDDFLSSRTYGRPNQEIARTFEGYPIATFYGWKTDGLYQNQQEINNDPNIANDSRKDDISPGDVRFLDLSGDGQITSDDRTILGSPHPDVTYGININTEYKNFNLNLHFAGAAGVEIYNADRMQGLDPTYPFNMYAEVENRWHGEGTSNSIPRMTTLRENLNHRTSDLFIESGDYLRLKSLTLGYNLPQNVIGSIGLRNARIYATGINVFTITPYSGIDPELGYTDGNLQRNVDFAQYPQPRTLTLGASLEF